MISGDRSILQGRRGAFYAMLEEFHRYWGRVDVVCPKNPAASNQLPVTNLRQPFPNVYFHPNPGGLWHQPRWIVKKGSELIGEHRHAVMSVHEYPPFYNGVGAEWLSRRTGVPYVIEVHHIVGYPRASSLNELLGRWLSRLFLVNDTYGAASVRCVSRGTADVLIRWGAHSDDIFIVPSFYLDREVLSRFAQQTSRFTPNRNEVTGSGQVDSVAKKYDLVCCGRLVSNKGLSDVLRAVALLPEVSLLIVGDGPLRAKLERQARGLGIARRVIFAGWLPEADDVYRAIQSARIFVCNSRSEGGPRVALEAMTLGMPIITTRVGVMPEVVRDGDNALFTTGTSGDLARSIQKLLDYPALRGKMGLEAREILGRFERKELIAKYAEFLQSHVIPRCGENDMNADVIAH